MENNLGMKKITQLFSSSSSGFILFFLSLTCFIEKKSHTIYVVFNLV